MANNPSESCPLYGKRIGCRADTSGEGLCGSCLWTHSALIRPWRDIHTEADEFFKWTDADNEKPRTCVIRRKRYTDDRYGEMVADVVEAWKRMKGSEVPGVFRCTKPAAEDDIVCDDCWNFMKACGRQGWFNEDRTVNENKVRKSCGCHK